MRCKRVHVAYMLCKRQRLYRSPRTKKVTALSERPRDRTISSPDTPLGVASVFTLCDDHVTVWHVRTVTSGLFRSQSLARSTRRLCITKMKSTLLRVRSVDVLTSLEPGYYCLWRMTRIISDLPLPLPAAEHHRFLALLGNTKLYCLLTEARVCVCAPIAQDRCPKPRQPEVKPATGWSQLNSSIVTTTTPIRTYLLHRRTHSLPLNLLSLRDEGLGGIWFHSWSRSPDNRPTWRQS